MLAALVLAAAIGQVQPPLAQPGEPIYYQRCRTLPGSARRYDPPQIRPPQPSGPNVEYFCQDCLDHGHIALNWHGHKRSPRCYSHGDPGLVYTIPMPDGTAKTIDNRVKVWSW